MNAKTIAVMIAALVLSACETTPESGSPVSPPQAGVSGDRPQPREAISKIEATPAAVAQNFVALTDSRREISEFWRDKSFEDFEATVPREKGTGFYIVNGDVVIKDPKQLEAFFREMVQQSERVSTGLIMHKPGGTLAKWSDSQKRNLTYCVSRSFGDRYVKVVADMQAAGNAWAQQGDIKFIHSAGQDGECNALNDQVLFDVRPVSGGDYLARAFFPDDSRGNRNVLIDGSAFETTGSLTLVGILRHELGHVLGFRHEHTRPESGVCFEDAEWEPLTDYDAFSVMHYPQCNGQGDWSLTLTANDKNGICKVYGAGPGFDGSSPGVCAVTTPPPGSGPLEPRCMMKTASASGSVARNVSDTVGSFAVSRGETLTVNMTGSGDPDLYVKLNDAPTTASYDCRPYRSGPNETCVLAVPNNTTAHIMVRGYTAGTYQLEIEVAAQ